MQQRRGGGHLNTPSGKQRQSQFQPGVVHGDAPCDTAVVTVCVHAAAAVDMSGSSQGSRCRGGDGIVGGMGGGWAGEQRGGGGGGGLDGLRGFFEVWIPIKPLTEF